jgi:hypothetical protein
VHAYNSNAAVSAVLPPLPPAVGPSSTSAATEAALEASLDVAQDLGWAWADVMALEAMVAQAQAAPQHLQHPLNLVAALYGLCRCARHAGAAGLLGRVTACMHLPLACCSVRWGTVSSGSRTLCAQTCTVA